MDPITISSTATDGTTCTQDVSCIQEMEWSQKSFSPHRGDNITLTIRDINMYIRFFTGAKVIKWKE